MSYANVIQGAAVRCYVNGVLLGYVTAVAWNTQTRHAELAEIDSGVVKEYAPSTYRTGGTFGILRGRSSGGLEGAGMVAFAEDLLRQKYLTIDLEDRVTGKVIHHAERVVVDDQSWQVSPKGLVTGTFTWRAITASNESRL